MATSRDYDELLFAWKGWRDASGKKMRNNYKRYVELSNKAAVLNGQCPAPLEPTTALTPCEQRIGLFIQLGVKILRMWRSH